jgi:hypothetical protein
MVPYSSDGLRGLRDIPVAIFAYTVGEIVPPPPDAGSMAAGDQSFISRAAAHTTFRMNNGKYSIR